MSTSEQYFRELAACLKRLPNEEREEVLRFYQEFAQESSLDSAEKLTEHFGAPRVLASKILAESAVKTAGSPRRGGAGRALVIALAALFSLPVTLPAVLAIVILLFVLAVLALAFCLALVTAVAAAGRAGVELLFHSFSFLAPFTAGMWLKTLGASLILLGTAAAVLGLIAWLAPKLMQKLTLFISKTVERSNHHAL